LFSSCKRKSNHKKTNLPNIISGKKTKQDDEVERPVTFSFGPDGITEANKRASSVTVPVGFGYKPSNIFSSQKMKSHDWLQVISNN